MLWILTREPADNTPLVEALRAQGADSLSLPCIQRSLRAWPAVRADVVMVTSRTAARLVPEGMAVAALADSTAPELTARGIIPVLTATGGAVGLAQAVAHAFPLQHVLYVHSAQAVERDEHTRALTIVRAACRLTTHVLYEVQLPASTAAQWRELQLTDYALFFASPSAVDHFLTLWQQHSQPAPSRVACMGESTLARWNAFKPAAAPAAFLAPIGTAAVLAKALT